MESKIEKRQKTTRWGKKGMLKRYIMAFCFICILAAMLSGCSKNEREDIDLVSSPGQPALHKEEVQKPTDEEAEPEPAVSYAVNPEGISLGERFPEPEGFTRIQAEEGSFLEFMRDFTLKPDGSPVLLYNKEEKGNQSGHAAVFDLSLSERDLQQCADSIMRIYGEYYLEREAYDQIAFHLMNGFLMKYTQWREGYRLNVDGNKTSMVKRAGADSSYESFLDYMNMVFAYAGTLSLEGECAGIGLDEIQAGDLFLKGGSPGHCVLAADMAENEEGEKAFLLAQGFMPAQEFHIIKNPAHEEDPWYYASEISYPLLTPGYTFPENSLMRWKDGL
ncbi:DUF4846 domain-containing protein [Anaerolentibacter hominis]|uniref:DUF4846 domain-containing protein n=1 Tax=Anaerolentibacter hominis TaxID=3079009 RepID=UPI0031B80B31